MNVVQVYEDTKDALGVVFKQHGIATSMQPVADKNDIPQVWLMPSSIDPKPLATHGCLQQRKDFRLTLLYACRMEELFACSEEIARIYTGYQYGDPAQDDHPYDAMVHIDGNIFEIKGSLVYWADVYGNYRAGG